MSEYDRRVKFVRESYEKEKEAHDLRQNALDKFETEIDEWEFTQGVRRNIKSLLSNLSKLLWEGAKWKPVGLPDMLTPAKTKQVSETEPGICKHLFIFCSFGI